MIGTIIKRGGTGRVDSSLTLSSVHELSGSLIELRRWGRWLGLIGDLRCL